MFVQTQTTCLCNNSLVDADFVKNVVDVLEPNIVSTGYAKCGKQSESTEAEEIAEEHKTDCVDSRSC